MKEKLMFLYNHFFDRSDYDFKAVDKIKNYVLTSDDSVSLKKEIIDIMFSEILETLNSDDLYVFLNFLFENDDLRYLLYLKMNDIFIDIILIRNFKSKDTSRNLDLFLKILSKSGYSIDDILKILEPYVDKLCKIIQNSEFDLFFEYYTYDEKMKFKNFINDNFLKNKSKIVYQMIQDSLVSRRECLTNFDMSSVDEVYLTFFENLFTDLMKNEGVTFLDVKILEKGFFCDVYKVGNKILKIGIPKAIYNIPNSKYILQPLIRYNLPDESSVDFFHVEVCEYVETALLSDREVYEFYCLLRSEGIIWSDAKEENIGRLVKKNCSFLNGNEVNINQKMNGFESNNEDVLDASSLVVLDIDLLFKEGCDTQYSHDNVFEKFWQEEFEKNKIK